MPVASRPNKEHILFDRPGQAKRMLPNKQSAERTFRLFIMMLGKKPIQDRFVFQMKRFKLYDTQLLNLSNFFYKNILPYLSSSVM